MKRLVCFASLVAAVVISSPARAISIGFILDGKAGLGLLPGNENPAVSGGSGGILSGGINYDTVTNALSIHIGWGSGNGFTDLTGNATLAHIHGATANPAPTGFFENAGAIINLHTVAGWNPNAVNGSFNGSVILSEAQDALLLAERYYINVHTVANGGGEIRGHLVVPEPSTLLLLALGVTLALRSRRSEA